MAELLRELGYVDKHNIVIEPRWADGKIERLAELAAELVRRQVDLIIVTGTPQALAAKRATSTIPIVMAAVGDPIGAGLVQSLARPGGNVTCFTATAGDEIYGSTSNYCARPSPGQVRGCAVAEAAAVPASPVKLKSRCCSPRSRCSTTQRRRMAPARTKLKGGRAPGAAPSEVA